MQDPALTRSYYHTALAALRFVDERSGKRRFGPDADARWYGFAGDDLPDPLRPDARARVLQDADRIDLLLRDADAQWPGAFGARVVFDLTDVAQDDAFGAGWTSVGDGLALWQQVTRSPASPDLAHLLAHLGGLWDTPLPPHALPALHPGSRWLLHGPAATAAAIVAFAASPAASWQQQVIVVAEPLSEPDIGPRELRRRVFARQLAALAPGLLGQHAPTHILREAPAAHEHPGHERIGAAMAETG